MHRRPESHIPFDSEHVPYSFLVRQVRHRREQGLLREACPLPFCQIIRYQAAKIQLIYDMDQTQQEALSPCGSSGEFARVPQHQAAPDDNRRRVQSRASLQQKKIPKKFISYKEDSLNTVNKKIILAKKNFKKFSLFNHYLQINKIISTND